jgi:hypothetical protein
MKTFILDLIPNIVRFSEKLDDITKLTSQHWVAVGELNDARVLYIFRTNSDLLISRDGVVEKAKWEYLGQNTLLIETKEKSYLFKQEFNDGMIMALRIDGKHEYALLVNESKFKEEFNSVEDVINFLRINYVEKMQTAPIEQYKSFLLTSDLQNVEYSIVETIEKYDLFYGYHSEITISYKDGSLHKLYKGKKSGRYFYESVVYGPTYFDSLDETATAFYNALFKGK